PCPLTAPRGRGGPWKAHLEGFDLHATDDRAGVARENPRDANEPNLPRPTPTLLVAECGDRIQTRRAARRVEAEEDADGARDQEGTRGRRRGEERRPLREVRDQPRRADAEDDAGRAAHQAERGRLDQELEQDVPAPRPHREPDADLARALGHRHQHDVHDADAAHEERHRGEAAEQVHQHGARVLRGLGDLVEITDGEVVVLARRDEVALAVERAGLRIDLWVDVGAGWGCATAVCGYWV